MFTIHAVHWLHLVAVATWTGGLIVLAALIVALRKAGASRELLRASAKQFARVSWVAMAVAVASGLAQVQLKSMSWSYGRLHAKLGLVTVLIVVTLVHQRTASRSPPAVRGILELSILLLSLGVFALAVWL